MILKGFALGGYRSFGAEPQFIAPLAKVNLFAGPNNSGKSNILRFVADHMPMLLAEHGRKYSRFSELDRPLSNGTPFSFGLPLSCDDERYLATVETLSSHSGKAILRDLFSCPSLSKSAHQSSLIWFVRTADALNQLPQLELDYRKIIAECGHKEAYWRDLWSDLLKRRGGGVDDWVKDVLLSLDPISHVLTDSVMIPAIRQVVAGEIEEKAFCGKGLIARLAAFQHPAHNQQHNRLVFNTIQDFVRDITGTSNAELEVPYTKDSITVKMDGKSLPLDSLGTGIHEVIILAAASTMLTKQLICMEEPEIHLHPVYQRKLIRYLHYKTSNQYLVCTHSAHLLDMTEPTIFHVSMESGETKVRLALTSGERWKLAKELGARPSDVLQANSIIWVEGPSDRIYLRHWIATVDPKLIEGIHYSILFYGGKVLSHFSALDPEVTELVSVLGANRHSALIMDRDRSNATDNLNETKTRVRSELTSNGGLCWVTAGREVENYITHDVLREAVSSVHKNITINRASGQFAKVFPKGVDKVRVAEAVVKQPANLDRSDLSLRMRELVNFIRDANHLDAIAWPALPPVTSPAKRRRRIAAQATS